LINQHRKVLNSKSRTESLRGLSCLAAQAVGAATGHFLPRLRRLRPRQRRLRQFGGRRGKHGASFRYAPARGNGNQEHLFGKALNDEETAAFSKT
jgi:hypothetical protein